MDKEQTLKDLEADDKLRGDGWFENGKFYPMAVTNGETGSDTKNFKVHLIGDSCTRIFDSK